MKDILITGACGYLGARLSKYLAENGYRVTVFDSYNPTPHSHWTSLLDDVVIGDIRDINIIDKLGTKHFDTAINLISLDHNKSEDNPNFVSSINILPTWNLLEVLTNSGLNKFIYFSTQQVLGTLPALSIDEKFSPNPINKYGLTHLLSEKIVNYYDISTNTKCINVRLSNGYGSPVFKENDCWWLVVNNLCKTAYEKGKIELQSDGSPRRDFIHNLDICKAIEILIEKGGEHRENIYNIASGKTISIKEAAHVIRDVYKKRYNKEIEICFPANSLVKNESVIEKSFIIDITRILDLGFKPKIELKDGIDKLFEYMETGHPETRN